MKDQTRASDIERRAQIAAEHREVIQHEILEPVAAGNLAQQQEVALAKQVCELADCAAEVSRLLE
jgi:hypothetical protein